MTGGYESTTIAVSAGDHKMAALLFDHIVPLHAFGEVPELLRSPPPLDIPGVIPPQDRRIGGAIRMIVSDKEPIALNPAAWNYIFTYDPSDLDEALQALYLFEKSKDRPRSEELENEHWLSLYRKCGEFPEEMRLRDELVLRLISRISSDPVKPEGIKFVPFLSSRTGAYKHLCEGTVEALELTIANARVIDTSKAQWEQILEFRKDSETRRKFRNFRLFLHENYEGKGASFIKDSLDKRLEDYEKSCRAHGFDLFESSITSLVDSKSLLGLLAIAAAGIVVGNPGVLTAAALAGACIETSKISLNIARRLYKRRAFKENHELAYVVELKERFSTS